MLGTKCIFQPAIGGRNLQGEEQLIRFIGHPDELGGLLSNRLSLTQAKEFCKDDPLEAAGTEADTIWRKNFYGSTEAFVEKRNSLKRQAKLETAYVSCWHRLNESSNLIRLAKEYATGAFQCAVTTSIENIQLSIPPPDGTPMWLDLVDVKYIPDERLRLEEVLDGEYPRCGYPELMFKRQNYKHEQEARFVMHDHSASSIFPGEQAILACERPKWRYAAIDSNQFIDRIYPLNDNSFSQVKRFLSGIKYQHNIFQVTPDILQNKLVGKV